MFQAFQRISDFGPYYLAPFPGVPSRCCLEVFKYLRACNPWCLVFSFVFSLLLETPFLVLVVGSLLFSDPLVCLIQKMCS